MKYHVAIVAGLLVAVLAIPGLGVEARDRRVGDTIALGETQRQLFSNGVTSDMSAQPPAAVPPQAVAPSDFRDLPSISGRYEVGKGAIVPYVGLGFSGGYGSELSRSLGLAPSSQSDVGLRSEFSQGLSPNEFQLGLRIPF